jgi:hypothetical protein
MMLNIKHGFLALLVRHASKTLVSKTPFCNELTAKWPSKRLLVVRNYVAKSNIGRSKTALEL